MTPGSDQVNRIRKAKRMSKPILLRDISQIHVHPYHKRDPNPYD